ncbi:phosphoribosylanthranilate isomerase [Mucilaginibacter ginsenosidivorax]|uniref:N-(5'-phosphoribosyl)anthranilate isomerase n=1 Tax=Mucilaginibacter ginsenosidivorax TaxID=862126 RepID=A0A5B8W7B7_9SPHI|nr:phosphoribosylanthranilate isomerase [Mucilaginibacter ginsenosidivorax]QEC79367.1 phosphoribosylanthranilate isomerase [Mucilaginibacter ginsenosidivorax]
MKIKVCGLKDPENIEAVAALKPDYLGFICYGPSPRYIGQLSAESFKKLPINIKKTAVFVNENTQIINSLIQAYNFDVIQLHGDESPEFSHSFRDRVTVFKAFGLDENFDFSRLDNYVNKVDYFLFDTKTAAYGGSGKTFDWGMLENYKLDVPFFLSGGISLDNLEEIKKINHPQFYGVDLNSRFETAPGVKDTDKLKQAFDIINKQPIINEIRS